MYANSTRWWTRCSEQVADVIRKAASVSIGCKISGRGTVAWWTQEYASARRQEAYEVAMHSKLASENSCDAAQAEEQKRCRNDSSGLCSHGMPTRPPHCGGRSMDQGSLAGSKSSCATRDPDPPANSAPVCESIRAADGTGNRVGGNYNGVP
jgi:hypothetical protein